MRACERHETSWEGGLQQKLKLLRIAAPDEEAVWVLPFRQRYTSRGYTLRPETTRYLLRRRLAASIRVGIEGQIDRSRAITNLEKLACIQMIPQRASDVMEACLPQHCVVEQSFHKNDLRGAPDLLPRV